MKRTWQQQVGRFANEETWTPISEWGRKMKADRERMNIVTVMKPQVMKKRIRVSNTPYVAGKCSMCPGHIGPQNKSGVCSKCCTTNVRRVLKIGPRPTCKVCGTSILRTCTTGLCAIHKAAAFSSRKCSQCPTSIREDNKSGLCRIHALVGRKIPPISRPTCPRPGCMVKLNRNNKTGLCREHSAVIRQQAYMARKKAA